MLANLDAWLESCLSCLFEKKVLPLVAEFSFPNTEPFFSVQVLPNCEACENFLVGLRSKRRGLKSVFLKSFEVFTKEVLLRET